MGGVCGAVLIGDIKLDLVCDLSQAVSHRGLAQCCGNHCPFLRCFHLGREAVADGQCASCELFLRGAEDMSILGLGSDWNDQMTNFGLDGSGFKP